MTGPLLTLIKINNQDYLSLRISLSGLFGDVCANNMSNHRFKPISFNAMTCNDNSCIMFYLP